MASKITHTVQKIEERLARAKKEKTSLIEVSHANGKITPSISAIEPLERRQSQTGRGDYPQRLGRPIVRQPLITTYRAAMLESIDKPGSVQKNLSSTMRAKGRTCHSH